MLVCQPFLAFLIGAAVWGAAVAFRTWNLDGIAANLGLMLSASTALVLLWGNHFVTGKGYGRHTKRR